MKVMLWVCVLIALGAAIGSVVTLYFMGNEHVADPSSALFSAGSPGTDVVNDPVDYTDTNTDDADAVNLIQEAYAKLMNQIGAQDGNDYVVCT